MSAGSNFAGRWFDQQAMPEGLMPNISDACAQLMPSISTIFETSGAANIVNRMQSGILESSGIERTMNDIATRTVTPGMFSAVAEMATRTSGADLVLADLENAMITKAPRMQEEIARPSPLLDSYVVNPLPAQQLEVLQEMNHRLGTTEQHLQGVKEQQDAMVTQQERADNRMVKLTVLMILLGLGTLAAAIIAAVAAVLAL